MSSKELQPVELSVNEIFERIKTALELQSDSELAKTMGIKPNKLSVWKIRNFVPYELIVALCRQYSLNLEWVLHGESKPKKETHIPEDRDIGEDFTLIPLVTGEISAGGGLVPDDRIEIRLAFRKDWIRRHGDPRNMSLIRVSGDSMEPTLLSGDIVLVDHSRNFIDPQGGIYAIALDDIIMIKRLQVIYPEGKIRIISDNPRYETFEVQPDQIKINGKVIWFGRELER